MRPHTLRALGTHAPNLLILPGGQEVGNYTAGSLQSLYQQVGFSPLDLPPEERPVITLKRMAAIGYQIPASLGTFARDVMATGCWLHVQEMEYWPEVPGPTAGQTEAQWMRDVLPLRIAAIDAWLTAQGADRKRTYLSYGNEFDMAAAPSTSVPKVWNGQPGSLDPNAEWFHREAAFMESAARLGCLTAFGNDASPVGLMRTLSARLQIYDAWKVKPAALVYHGYGFGGHHAKQLPLLLQTTRAAGFKGRVIAGEVARRVDTDDGDEADRELSGEWWRQFAFEVAKHPGVWSCFFYVNQITWVAQIMEAFRSPVPTGAPTGVDETEIATQAWGIRTALLPEDEREADLAGEIAGLRAARDTI